MARQGREDRNQRFEKKRSGVAATSSQDFLHLAQLLFTHSKEYAAKCTGGNCSRNTLAGLPMLLAALQAFVVECEFLLHPAPPGKPLDINTYAFMTQYGIADDLRENFEDLIELRNEIIHSSHATTGTPDNWPPYLQRIKTLGLLESTGEEHDYVLLTQIASHRLFAWAVQIVRALYERVIDQVHTTDPSRVYFVAGHLTSFDPPWFD
jgi:hypothetical protein